MTPEQIESGARTVAHLADYLAELKLAAAALIERATASRRGYFTPSEEEAVRRLQVSYWKSRSALFDVVISLRDVSSRDGSKPSEDLMPSAFLVAYAAAILLVDAARFLRESFEPLPLVREKLNEPEPHFGIPKDTYTTVQKSLTSPRHAWHLYHAMQYFREHQADLSARAVDPMLAPVMAVILRLQSRLDVPVARLAKTRLDVRTRRVVSRLRHGLLTKALYGIQKLVSSLAAGVYVRHGHRPQLPQAVADRIGELLQPGDVIICRKEYAITNYFLPGYWKHAALYLGEPAELEALGIADHENVRPRWARLLSPDALHPHRVLEAMKDGVQIRPVASPCASDAVVVVRPRLATGDVAEALARGLCHEGKPYDFDFDFTRADRLVCTEVVYRSYEGIGGMRFDLTSRAGRLTFSAEDLVAMALKCTHFEPTAVFAPAYDRELAVGTQAGSILQRTQRCCD
ncbi:MAG: hypothetical protein HQ567_30705 [Candidatus Nealsonbacteria bacterium]|nr:hypothetical protein [Candidatus Nealsonbacteria bacterium]